MTSHDLMVTMKLFFVIIATLLVPESRGQGQCDSDTDCQDPLPCCSQYKNMSCRPFSSISICSSLDMVIVERVRDFVSLLKNQKRHLRAQDVFWKTQRLSEETSLSLLAAAELSWKKTRQTNALPGDKSVAPPEPKIHFVS